MDKYRDLHAELQEWMAIEHNCYQDKMQLLYEFDPAAQSSGNSRRALNRITLEKINKLEDCIHKAHIRQREIRYELFRL
jgi:hypothetical protein